MTFPEPIQVIADRPGEPLSVLEAGAVVVRSEWQSGQLICRCFFSRLAKQLFRAAEACAVIPSDFISLFHGGLRFRIRNPQGERQFSWLNLTDYRFFRETILPEFFRGNVNLSVQPDWNAMIKGNAAEDVFILQRLEAGGVQKRREIKNLHFARGEAKPELPVIQWTDRLNFDRLFRLFGISDAVNDVH